MANSSNIQARDTQVAFEVVPKGFANTVHCLIFSMIERGITDDDVWWGQDFHGVRQMLESMGLNCDPEKVTEDVDGDEKFSVVSLPEIPYNRDAALTATSPEEYLALAMWIRNPSRMQASAAFKPGAARDAARAFEASGLMIGKDAPEIDVLRLSLIQLLRSIGMKPADTSPTELLAAMAKAATASGELSRG